MGTVISNLKARFGVDTTDFKKGLKDGEKATDDFKGAAGDTLNEFASMFGVNMTAVNAALSTANKSLSFMGQSFAGAAAGGNKLTIAMKFLKTALLATGLGAIVVVLGSIIAYFTKTGEGADKFAKILMQFKSVINNVIDRLAVFGKGLFEIMTGKFKAGWETMTGAFKDMGTEIIEDWKAAGALADQMDTLEDKEIALITSLEARKAKAAELRLLAKEEQDDQKKKLDLLNQAEKLIKSVYADQIDLEKERLAILREQLAIQTSDPTDEQRREIAEQEAKINGLLREQSVELKGLARERNTVAAAVKKEFEQFKSYSNLKLPQMLDPKVYANIKRSLEDLHHTFIQTKESMGALWDVLGKVGVNSGDALKEALKEISVATGVLLGNLTIGKAGLADFGQVIMSAFADLLTIMGTAMIAAGVAKLNFDAAMLVFGGAGGAIAAGIAAVAAGQAIKGSLKSAVSSGSTGKAQNDYTYDTRTSAANAFQLSFPKTITLVAKGGDLVGVLNVEARRRDAVT